MAWKSLQGVEVSVEALVIYHNTNNNNNKPSVFPLSGVWGGKMYAVHTSTSDEVERLFPKDPWLKAQDITQTHSKAQKQMT